MPHTIVFDTNYLRSFGDRDYRNGQVPQKLHDQIAGAFARGDLVVLPKTVRLETNAWLKKQSEIARQKLVQATDLLQQAGHKVLPGEVEVPAEVDILTVLSRSFPDVHLLEPSMADYKEAERRVSYRLPPLPKNPAGEEFRDRIIWCQLVNYSKAGATPILIVSGDRLFRNGATSDEGKSAGIEVVEGETDLDQWLDRRPHHIQVVIDQLLMFAAELQKQGIDLQAENVTAVEELRNVYDPNGLLIQRFTLRTTEISDISSPVLITMISLGSVPLSLSLAWNGRTVDVRRDVSTPEKEQLAREQLRGTMEFEQVENELRALIESQR